MLTAKDGGNERRLAQLQVLPTLGADGGYVTALLRLNHVSWTRPTAE